jgi:hypothetical protein
MSKRSLILAGVAALTASLAGPIAADVIAYRTEDGVFAYTDDRDKVPARYADDAVTVRDSKLRTYPHLTVEDTPTARAVTARLQNRLDYLRQLNAASASERVVAATTAAAAAHGGTVISLPTNAPGFLGPDGKPSTTGGRSFASPSIEVTAGASDEPIITEPILTKEDGRIRTRRATIVKQGDKILAIMKGRSHQVDVNSDIYDEDELLEPRQ